MIYVVSGFMRSGTSMMMECLEAGGIPVAYSPENDDRLYDQFKDGPYLPNTKYYELNPRDYFDPDFYNRFNGRAVKALLPFLNVIPPGEYHVIHMVRDLPDIFRSYAATISLKTTYYDDEKFNRERDLVLSSVKDRKSILSFTDVNYNECIENPIRVFSELRDQGWPIDPEKAAAIPDRGKRRYYARAKELTNA